MKKHPIVILFVILALAIAPSDVPARGSKFEKESIDTKTPVVGNAFHLLDEGKPGFLSVVGIENTSMDDPVKTVVVFNDTSEPQANVVVHAFLQREPGGEMSSVTSLSWPASPPVISPGGIGIAEVVLEDTLRSTDDLVYVVLHQFIPSEADLSWVEMTLDYFDLTEEIEQGTFTNNTDFTMESFDVNTACFNEEGEITGYSGFFLRIGDKGAPGDQFEWTLGDLELEDCSFFLMSAQGSPIEDLDRPPVRS